MRTGLQAINGDGSRLALGAGGNFVGTRDGFFHGGHVARLAGNTLEGRFGRAGGFGWDSATSFAFNRPVNDLSWAPGLRVNLSRAARNGYSTYASSAGDFGRCGGVQHVSGALCNAGFTGQFMRLGLPVSYEEETTSTYRGQSGWSDNALAQPQFPSIGQALVGPKQATGVAALTQSLRCGEAAAQNYGRSFGIVGQQSHTLRQAKTWRCGINFDRFTPMWLPRLRVQALNRDVRAMELSHLGHGINSIRLERVQRREYRAMLSLPFGRIASFFSSFVASLLPQAWFVLANERRLETKVFVHGALHSNRRWQQIEAGFRGNAPHVALNRGSLDDALDAEIARLPARSRTHRRVALESVAAEERQEKRGKLCVPLNYLPMRAANATQFFEVSYGHGRRASLNDAQSVALAKLGRLSKGDKPLKRSYQTFRDVTYERHQQTRLSNQTEVRASWEDGGEKRLAQLTLHSTWTFNAKNEAFCSYTPDAMRDAFGAVNGLFGAELLAPDATPVRGECRVRSAYTLSRGQVQQLCATLRAAPNATPASAELLAPGCLAELRRRLTEAKTEAEQFDAVADFVTRARRIDPPAATGSVTELTPAPVLAMALLHQLVPDAPRVATKVEHDRRIPALEQAHAIVSRYDDGPLDGQTNAYQLNERLAAGLLAVRDIERLQAPDAPRAYFDEAGARKQQAEVKRLTHGLYRVLDVGEAGGRRHTAVLARLERCPLPAEDLQLLARCLAEQARVACTPKLILAGRTPAALKAPSVG